MSMNMTSSMNAGIAGLSANATRLATISDNIANSGTHGYRRARTGFHAMVLGDPVANQGSYAAGGVRTITTRLVDQGGQIVSTQNATDLAVNGRGFLPVTTSLGARNGGDAMPFMLTPTGSFRFDADGYLRNDAGLTLLGWPASADGTVAPANRNSADGLVPVRLVNAQQAPQATSQVSLGLNLPATGTLPDAPGTGHELTLEYIDTLGLRQSMQVGFTPTIDPLTHTNTWTMQIEDPANGTVLGTYALQFGNGPADGGRLVDVTAQGASPAFDPDTGTIALTIDDQEIAFEIGRLLDPDGMTQTAGQFRPHRIEKDGFAAGQLLGINVTEEGLIQAIYDEGLVRTLFQVPLVDVPNPNGLMALSDQAYRVSAESGGFFLWKAGDGPTGTIMGNALQQSATDIGEELTGLIQTQRAYSSNAKVIQTVDEMLQETTSLKR